MHTNVLCEKQLISDNHLPWFLNVQIPSVSIQLLVLDCNFCVNTWFTDWYLAIEMKKRWQKDILPVWLATDWGLIPFPFSALSFQRAASFSLLLSAFWIHEILLCLINRKCAKKEPYFKSIYVRGATETIDHTKQAFCLILKSRKWA